MARRLLANRWAAVGFSGEYRYSLLRPRGNARHRRPAAACPRRRAPASHTPHAGRGNEVRRRAGRSPRLRHAAILLGGRRREFPTRPSRIPRHSPGHVFSSSSNGSGACPLDPLIGIPIRPTMVACKNAAAGHRWRDPLRQPARRFGCGFRVWRSASRWRQPRSDRMRRGSGSFIA